MQTITLAAEEGWEDVAALLKKSHMAVALTGAGISVPSGIPDFRSHAGLWQRFPPERYATLDVFHKNPGQAWALYRAMGKILQGKKPNAAHRALAELEMKGLLAGIITQNIDGLHQQAGSQLVFEIHGDHQQLQCLRCATLISVRPEHFTAKEVPCCPSCARPLKPNVVLFGESVRQLDAIENFVASCDLLLVIGTSCQVYPAASLPEQVRRQGGHVVECNQQSALTSASGSPANRAGDLFLQGNVANTLPRLVQYCD
nr:NAD-dependent deacylase [uncultured Desulfobulbus sp.]